MKETTALILKGFIDAMNSDRVGWNKDVIGERVYEVFRIIENPLDIPEDKKENKK